MKRSPVEANFLIDDEQLIILVKKNLKPQLSRVSDGRLIWVFES